MAQTGLVLNGAFIRLNNGNSGSPVYLVINDTSTVSIKRNSGHIISEGQYNFIQWNAGANIGNFNFPFGYSTTDYLPLAFTKLSSGNANIAFSTWTTDSANNPHPTGVYSMQGIGDSLSSAIDRFWYANNSASATANLSFSYRGSENTTNNPTLNIISAQHWNGNAWMAPLTGSNLGVTAGIGNTAVLGATAFGSPWVLVHGVSPLPNDELRPQANWTNPEENAARIRWFTLSEKHSDLFEIQRSEDGNHFNTIGEVVAAGSSSERIDYSFVDQSSTLAAWHTFYYRLKQVSSLGGYRYSEYIEIQHNKKDPVLVFPNPSANAVQVIIPAAIAFDAKLSLFNSMGKMVFEKNLRMEAGIRKVFTLDHSHLPAGTYVLQVINNREITNHRLIFKE